MNKFCDCWVPDIIPADLSNYRKYEAILYNIFYNDFIIYHPIFILLFITLYLMDFLYKFVNTLLKMEKKRHFFI